MERSRNHRISVAELGSGVAAVYLADYEDINWNTDYVQTGIGRFKKEDRKKAEFEALGWAITECLPIEVNEIADEQLHNEAILHNETLKGEIK